MKSAGLSETSKSVRPSRTFTVTTGRIKDHCPGSPRAKFNRKIEMRTVTIKPTSPSQAHLTYLDPTEAKNQRLEKGRCLQLARICMTMMSMKLQLLPFPLCPMISSKIISTTPTTNRLTMRSLTFE